MHDVLRMPKQLQKDFRIFKKKPKNLGRKCLKLPENELRKPGFFG